MSDSRLLISVGNTRTRIALVRTGQLEPSIVLENSDEDAILARLRELAGDHQPSTLIASVNHALADRIQSELNTLGIEPVRFGRDVPVPIATALSNDKTVGIDRLLDALGAFARSQQACVVIDAGTAVTVDFVDGQGVFQGGAILPGVTMMLRALHAQTAALPLVTLTPDLLPPTTSQDEEEASEHRGGAPFGKNTEQAIAVGVVSAVRGAAHELIDRYANYYGGYPRVVATGGDAPMLFQNDQLVEHIVPDLVLIGMMEGVNRLRELDDQ